MPEYTLTLLESYDQVQEGDLVPNAALDINREKREMFGAVESLVSNSFWISRGRFTRSLRVLKTQLDSTVIFRQTEDGLEILAGKDVYQVLDAQSQPKCTKDDLPDFEHEVRLMNEMHRGDQCYSPLVEEWHLEEYEEEHPGHLAD